jgi:hypothetical protein
MPVRLVKEIGIDDIATMKQFLDALERRGQSARFEVELIDEGERKAWTSARVDLEELRWFRSGRTT